MSYDGSSVTTATLRILKRDPHATVATVSRTLQLDRHTLERCLRKATGRTFRELKARTRLEHAELFFAEHPNASIKEAAAALGYGTQQTFARWDVRGNAGHRIEQA
jgi:AraC-like DNA-binding protein